MLLPPIGMRNDSRCTALGSSLSWQASKSTPSEKNSLSRKKRALRRSEEQTSELQSLMRISYAVFCVKNNTNNTTAHTHTKTEIGQRAINTTHHAHHFQA